MLHLGYKNRKANPAANMARMAHVLLLVPRLRMRMLQLAGSCEGCLRCELWT